MGKKTLTIAVTGLNNTDNPGPGIPVIRGLRESKDFDVRIIGLAYENLEPGIYMKELVDKTYQIPYPSIGSEDFLNRLFYIHSVEKLDMIFPNFDSELYTLIKFSDRIHEQGIKTFLPELEIFEARHKSELNKFGEKYNVLVPKSLAIGSVSDVAKITESFEFPVLIKGKFYDAYVAYSPEQALNHFNKLSAEWGLPVIVQEYIKGTEVNVVAAGDGYGNTIASVPMRKQYITDKGKAWSGISIKDQNLLELTDHIISQTKWRGGMELELIKTNENKYYLIEINPRIPAWVYLAVAAGQNIPAAIVNLALGMPQAPFTRYDAGKMFIRYSFDLIGDISQFEQLSIMGEL